MEVTGVGLAISLAILVGAGFLIWRFLKNRKNRF